MSRGRVLLLVVAVVAGVCATTGAATDRPLESVQARTLLVLPRPITGVVVGGTRVAFSEVTPSCGKARHCNKDTIDIWSRKTRVLRRFRDPCGADEWVVIAGRHVYWECDELGSTVQRTRIYGGIAGRRSTLRMAASDGTMSLSGDGEQALFSDNRGLWRLQGTRKRLAVRGADGHGEILDVDAGRILISRYTDGRIALFDQDGKLLHAFSAKFDCCLPMAGFQLFGEQLVIHTTASSPQSLDAIEVYDIATETLLRHFDLKHDAFMRVSDVNHGYALYAGLQPDVVRVLNIADGTNTVVRTRGNQESYGIAALGDDGVYYIDRIRGRGYLRFIPYAELQRKRRSCAIGCRADRTRRAQRLSELTREDDGCDHPCAEPWRPVNFVRLARSQTPSP